MDRSPISKRVIYFVFLFYFALTLHETCITFLSLLLLHMQINKNKYQIFFFTFCKFYMIFLTSEIIISVL